MAWLNRESHLRENQGANAATKDFAATIQEEFPWLTAQDIGAAFARVASAANHLDGSASSVEPREDVRPDAVVHEVDVDDVVAELHAAREKWEWGEGVLHEHFYVYQRGGASTAAKKGIASDCVTCNARPHVFEWCRAVGCNRIRSFAFTQHGGEYICNVLAREWVRTSEYYYTCWTDADCPDVFDYSGVPEFNLSEEFVDVSIALDVESNTFTRAIEIKNWVPANLALG